MVISMRFQKSILSFFLLCLTPLCLIHCQNTGSNSSNSQSEEDIQSNAVPGELKEASCNELHISKSLRSRSSCYWFAVPESRDESDAPVIELPVVVIKSTSENKNSDPLVFLSGGPGFPAISQHSLNFSSKLDFNRDMIIMDQRGTGLSKPSILCNNLEGDDDIDDDLRDGDGDRDGNGDGDGDRGKNNGDKDRGDITFLQCYKKINDKGINLSNYNTQENAADFADLINALQLKKVNYYGFSYGTRLALELLRRHPEHIRSVILDGALPTHIYPMSQTAQGLWEALVRMAKDCTENVHCNQRYADTSNNLDFSATFTALLNRLDGSPIKDKGKTFNKKDIVTFLSQFISSGEFARLPFIVKKLYDKEFSILSSGMKKPFSSKSAGNPEISLGMALSVVCHDEVPFESDSRVQAEKVKFHIEESEYKFKKKICESQWILKKKGSSKIKQAVKSDLPVLLLSGAYDHRTPPFWAKSAKKHFSKSYHFLFPSGGHGNLGTPVSPNPNHRCGYKLAKDFILDPNREPQDKCFSNLPKPQFLILP